MAATRPGSRRRLALASVVLPTRDHDDEQIRSSSMTVQPHVDLHPELLNLPTPTHAVLLTASGRRAFARYAEALYRAAEQPGIPNRQAIRNALRQVLVLLA